MRKTHGTLTGQRGFSLIEMLLSVAIIGLLTGVTLPLYRSFLTRNELDITSQQVAEAMRRAQVYARGAKSSSAWSVEVQPTVVTLFKGTNFGGRDTSFDEVITLPGGITASGTSEVRFAVLTALPNATASVVLTTSASETKTVTVNAEGMVNY